MDAAGFEPAYRTHVVLRRGIVMFLFAARIHLWGRLESNQQLSAFHADTLTEFLYYDIVSNKIDTTKNIN